MTLVVDASVAVKWVCDEADSDAAAALLARDDLAAPALWLVEANSALWRRARIGELTEDEAEERARELALAPVASIPCQRDLPSALRLALDLRHSIYDCLYLALAIREDCAMVTADRKFRQLALAQSHIATRIVALGYA